MRIPDASAWYFVTKDEMADYLEEYARRFKLPVRTGVTVDGLTKADGWFVVSAGDRRFEAKNVIVATGAHRIAKLPDFASELDPRIVQMHSSEYRDPSQLAEGDVLVVGAGNSGAEIAYELVETRRCLLAGKSSGQIPVPHGSLRFRPGFRVFRFFMHRIVRVDTRIGRKLRPELLAHAAPLVRRREQDLAAVGIERVERVAGVQDGLPVLEDGRVVDVPNVIWCTGFRNDFSWIDLPVFDGDGQPQHYRGVVESEPGLYFLGLVFQYSARPTCCRAGAEMPGTSRSTSRRGSERRLRSSLRRLSPRPEPKLPSERAVYQDRCAFSLSRSGSESCSLQEPAARPSSVSQSRRLVQRFRLERSLVRSRRAS